MRSAPSERPDLPLIVFAPPVQAGAEGRSCSEQPAPAPGGQPPVGFDELELAGIDPLPSWVCCQDMADFAESITDERAGHRLVRAIQGRGAFRRFGDELRDEYPDLLPAWYAFRDVRARRVNGGVQWLASNSLIGDAPASRFLAGHPDPEQP